MDDFLSDSSFAESAGRKKLSCVFLSDVLCGVRKSEKVVVLERCWSCDHYKRFMLEAELEDERDWVENERIWRFGYPKEFDVK